MYLIFDDNKIIGDKKIETHMFLEKNGWKACKNIRWVMCQSKYHEMNHGSQNNYLLGNSKGSSNSKGVGSSQM